MRIALVQGKGPTVVAPAGWRLATAFGVVALAAVACGGGAAPDPATPSPRSEEAAGTVEDPAAAPTESTAGETAPAESGTVASATPTVEISAEVLGKARGLMTRSFDIRRGMSLSAIEQLGELGHPGAIIPLVELTRFASSDREIETLSAALRELTGEDISAGNWQAWYEWLGEHPEIEPIRGYVNWKGSIYSEIDRRFDRFFSEQGKRRVPMWAVQWGGVSLDGIPPLEDPEVMPGDQATYLQSDDPVFGAVVNGEARAYPWRIMAWHELANDEIGGKPVTFVF